MRDPEIGQSWFDTDLFFSDAFVDCGPISVEFYYDNTDKSPIDTVLFRDERNPNKFVIQQTIDTTAAGSYAIKYKAYHTLYADNFVELSNPIIFTITDPCDEPVGVTPSSLVDQVYTIT